MGQVPSHNSGITVGVVGADKGGGGGEGERGNTQALLRQLWT